MSKERDGTYHILENVGLGKFLKRRETRVGLGRGR